MTTNDHIAKLRADALAAPTYEFSPEEDMYDFDPDLLDLDPVAGATILGTLTETEQKLFRISCAIENEIEELSEEINVELRGNAAAAMLKGTWKPAHSPRDLTKNFDRSKLESLMRSNDLWTKVNATFWYSVRCRLQTFTTLLAIRAGYTICQIGHKV